jgi:hypothetical protein
MRFDWTRMIRRFVLVTLNRLVLEDVAKSIAADIQKATREFEASAGRLPG